MLIEKDFNTIQFLSAGLFWFLMGVCLTKILNESYRLDVRKIWAWVPFAQFWVLAKIGRVSLWSNIWKAMLTTFVVVMAVTGVAMATDTMAILLIGNILGGIAMMYWLIIPTIEYGGFSNARLLALLMGLPVINAFVLIYIAWNGDWA